MASIGHLMFGAGVASTSRAQQHAWVPWLAYPALALLPDADVVAFVFGIPYADQFGHRGASHSVLVCTITGALFGVLIARFTQSRALIGAVCGAIAMVSHGLFDAMTTGGEGVALLWPFTDERFFFPWRPIPVAPIGLGFLSARGLYCAAVELALFAPFVVFAVLTRRKSEAPDRQS